MRRVECTPRSDWRTLVEAQGLTYAVDRSPSGPDRPYWHEAARYELSAAEVDQLEAVTEELHDLCVSAARHLLRDPHLSRRLGLPEAAPRLLEMSLDDAGGLSLYGRFDLVWDGTGDPKVLEYNADTPAGLVEAAVCQWYWLEDLHPDRDQWNLIHERLVRAWGRWRRDAGLDIVHFAVGQHEPNEDWATVAYLRDTAQEAGLTTLGVVMEDIGWDPRAGRFVDRSGRPLTTCFRMYPAEWMLTQRFGVHLLTSGPSTTRWVEPLWKTLLGSKAILAALWELSPGHPNLLPAFLDHPHGMPSYVTKPMYGWEGAGIGIHTPAGHRIQPHGHTLGQEVVFQEYVELPRFDGSAPVLGTWVIDGHAAGLGIRESDGPVTDAAARFVPHLMQTTRSTPAQVAAWLDEPRLTTPRQEH